MGVFFKNDLEKIIKEADKTSETNDRDALSYGEKMRNKVALLMSKNRLYGQHIEGTISGGSLVLSPLNRLTKKGRAFEQTMDRQGDEAYNKKFESSTHDFRLRDDEERDPDNPIYPEYNMDDPEYIQDIEYDESRNTFATHRGKNDVVIDLVLTDGLYITKPDEYGNFNKVIAPFGIEDVIGDGVLTGQYTEDQDGESISIKTESVDGFTAEWKRRVAEAEAINRAKLEELGYELIGPEEEGYPEQQRQIADDVRFIETFPDLRDLPKLKDFNGVEYQFDYDIVIHINGKKVQPQDMDLAFHQLARKGEYERPTLEAGRDFLIQQGFRGAAFHASILPQQTAMALAKAPGKSAEEGQRVLTGNILQQLLSALNRGISR